MEHAFDLQAYLSAGVENIVKSALRATLQYPAESAYLLRFAAASKRAADRRSASEAGGKHIPPFLIASITSACNLHCKGCYARANHLCEDAPQDRMLTDGEWQRVFTQARELGVSFILLAGGEPLMRRGVLVEAGKQPDIFFPVFTNGTLLHEKYLDLFAQNRNLMPILSIEGGETETDRRRGDGVYDQLMQAMTLLQRRKLLFGVSVTVTTENLADVASAAFLTQLSEKGCAAVFFVEYVPVAAETAALAPGAAEREELRRRLARFRRDYANIVFLSFPGDEQASGGCLAAGRGFFHLNPYGGAELCPFSPYSDCSVRDHTLTEVLDSALFTSLRNGALLTGEHDGGCVLYQHQAEVASLLQT